MKKSIWRTIDVSQLIAVHGASHSNTCGALRALAFNYIHFLFPPLPTPPPRFTRIYLAIVYLCSVVCYCAHERYVLRFGVSVFLLFFSLPMSQRTMSAEKLSKRILYVQALFYWVSVVIIITDVYYVHYSFWVEIARYHTTHRHANSVFACVCVCGVGLTYDAIFIWSLAYLHLFYNFLSNTISRFRSIECGDPKWLFRL